MFTTSRQYFPKMQRGVSLIEILITALILGIGLLGVAALQVSSMTGNQEGYFHSQATSIAEDLASKIRASQLVTVIPNVQNRTSINYGAYIAPYLQNPVACAGNAPDCSANNCDNRQIAAADLQEACDAIATMLPAGTQLRVINSVAAAVGGAPASRLSIVVDWNSAAPRTDAGEVQNINANCGVVVPALLNSGRNCVIVELMP